MGGWGLRDIFLFNRSLAAISLWQALMKDGIWHRVIKDKYLIYCLVSTWFRTTSASQTWKNLLKSLLFITHWSSWRHASGHSVLIGKDLILGMGNSSLLSRELLTVLKHKNISYLYQARGINMPGIITTQWKNSFDLRLTGELAKEWDFYCRDLIGVGVQLHNKDDELKWIGEDK
jgi:hypothetical protein